MRPALAVDRIPPSICLGAKCFICHFRALHLDGEEHKFLIYSHISLAPIFHGTVRFFPLLYSIISLFWLPAGRFVTQLLSVHYQRKWQYRRIRLKRARYKWPTVSINMRPPISSIFRLFIFIASRIPRLGLVLVCHLGRLKVLYRCNWNQKLFLAMQNGFMMSERCEKPFLDTHATIGLLCFRLLVASPGPNSW